MGRRPRGVEPDVDHFHLTGQREAGREEQTGLEGGEGHRAVGGTNRGAGGARQAVDATRDVGRQHGCAARVRARPRPVEAGAVRGVDQQIAGRESRRHRVGRDDRDADTQSGQAPSRGPTVGPVVAATGDDGDAPPVRPAQHPHCRASQGGPCPLDEDVDRLGRGGVDRLHLLGRDDRDHGTLGSVAMAVTYPC
jgi:hypothetical protein